MEISKLTLHLLNSVDNDYISTTKVSYNVKSHLDINELSDIFLDMLFNADNSTINDYTHISFEIETDTTTHKSAISVLDFLLLKNNSKEYGKHTLEVLYTKPLLCQLCD